MSSIIELWVVIAGLTLQTLALVGGVIKVFTKPSIFWLSTTIVLTITSFKWGLIWWIYTQKSFLTIESILLDLMITIFLFISIAADTLKWKETCPTCLQKRGY